MSSSPKKYSVAIIDSTGRNRIYALGNIFKSAQCNVVYFKEIRDRKWYTDSESELSAYSIILWHGGDYKELPIVHLSGHLIFYGGFGAYDNRIPPDADRISHKIESQADVRNAITAGDVEEILRYICDGSPKPACLLPLNRPLAKTLLILCQGYLAAWAIEQTEISKSEDNPEAQYSALKSMAWFDLEKSNLSHQLLGRCHSDTNGVQGAEWWKAALGDCDVREVLSIELGGSKMSSLDSNPFDALFTQIDGDTTIQPKAVADAYNFLVNLI